MQNIALYYPYSSVRDEAWLRAAALYWPKLARLVPQGRRPTDDGAVVRALLDEGILFDIDPKGKADGVAELFFKFVDSHHGELRQRYPFLRDFDAPRVGYEAVNSAGLAHAPEIGWVHVDKVTHRLATALVTTRLAVMDQEGTWIGLHRDLASVYLSALAEQVAEANQLAVVTDQPDAYGVLNAWDMETLTRALLPVEEDEPLMGRRRPEDVTAMYAAVAIDAVVPKGLADVPIEKIVEARHVLEDEFYVFHDHLATMVAELQTLAVEDPTVLRHQLEVLVKRDLGPAVADLERGLLSLGLAPVRAVLSRLAEVPAVIVSGAAAPAAVGRTGQVAAELVESSAQATRQRRSPAGYLLGLREELDPQGVLDRLRRTLRRASPRRSGRRRRWRRSGR